jgi:hypothetical protein
MNTPTLMQSEEKIAPWNKKSKMITVNISQCLSTTVDVEVPENFDESDERVLKDIVREQIILPSEVIFKHSQDCWYVDDFCVML